jgi:AcrR family transcriptional regulator
VKLEEALLALVAERGYERASVRALVERARVGKSTLYEHFRDKDAVLASRLARLARGLRAPVATSERFAFVEPLLEHVNAHRPLAARLRRSSAGALVLARFGRVVRALVAEELARLYPQAERRAFERAVIHVTGGLVSLLEAPATPHERLPRVTSAESFRRLVLPGLDAYLGQVTAPS